MQFKAKPGDTFIRSDNYGAGTIATFNDELGHEGELVCSSHVRIPNPSGSMEIHRAHDYLTGSALVYVEPMNDNYFELPEKVCAITNGVPIANDRFECDVQAWSGSFEDADRGVA